MSPPTAANFGWGFASRWLFVLCGAWSLAQWAVQLMYFAHHVNSAGTLIAETWWGGWWAWWLAALLWFAVSVWEAYRLILRLEIEAKRIVAARDGEASKQLTRVVARVVTLEAPDALEPPPEREPESEPEHAAIRDSLV